MVKGSIYGVVIGLLMLILYIFIFIPFIVPTLNSMFIDWLNGNSAMFQHQWCTVHYVINQSTGEIMNYTDCQSMDLRPAFIFIWQFTMYFGIPIALVLIGWKMK